MATLQRIDKVGEGTYGVVYRARYLTEKDARPVAVKRNLADISTHWVANVRELDILARLRGGPYIVDLLNVSFGDPFARAHPMTPINTVERRLKEDRIHFVMEYVPPMSDTFLTDKAQCTPLVGKVILTQLLLAVEFMHARGVTHRDLKPANLLLANTEKEGVRLKLCDFGMSQVLCRGVPSTPGVATSWYRAPEVCCGSSIYSYKADMWAVGCIGYEIFGPAPYLSGAGDNDVDAFSAILGRYPRSPNRAVIDKIQRTGRVINVTAAALPIRRRSWEEQLAMVPTYVEEFKRTPGSIAQLVEVLDGLLELDPDRRWSATQALEHPFFDYLRDYINEVRKRYPPLPLPLPVIKIVRCAERQRMVTVAFAIYNERHRFDWYKHRIIFHAMELFDRYLEWAHVPGNAASAPGGALREGTSLGRLHTDAEVELRFWVCLYLMHKYYATMAYPTEWTMFAPTIYITAEQNVIAEQFEVLLIKDVAQYMLYRDTLLEISDEFPYEINEHSIRELLLAYGQYPGWEDGSVRALYRSIFKIPTPPPIPEAAAALPRDMN